MAEYICDKCKNRRKTDDYPPTHTPRWVPDQISGNTCNECEWGNHRVEQPLRSTDLIGEE